VSSAILDLFAWHRFMLCSDDDRSLNGKHQRCGANRDYPIDVGYCLNADNQMAESRQIHRIVEMENEQVFEEAQPRPSLGSIW
jgi:hypothetical protein